MNYGRRNQLPFSEGNAVRPRFRGAQILDSVRTLIDGAQATIHFEMYAWADDATGRDFLDRMLAARARGVQIKGVVDHLGSWDAVRMLETSGLDIRFYHPIGWNLPWRLWNRRNHRKLLIVDGAKALVGSANWADEYNDEIPPKYYRDMGLEVQGPVVGHLEADFRKSWMRTGGTGPVPRKVLVVPETGPDWIREVPIQLVSSLNGGGRVLRRHLRLILGQLRDRVVLANAYFIPGPRVLRAMLRAVERGVKMDLIAPGDSDHRFVQAASRATFDRLLRAGVRIWERRERVFHAKVAVLDDDLVMLGSANLDSVSFRHNLELSLMLRSRILAVALQEALDEDRAKSRLLTTLEWEALPAFHRVIQRFAYLFWRWL